MNASSMMASLSENSRRYEYELRKLQLELSNAHEQELRLQQTMSSIFPQLASHQLSGGATLSAEVQRLLEQRTQAEAELRQDLARTEEAIALQVQAVANVVDELEGMAAGLEQRLEQDPLYQQQVALLNEALALCAEADRSYKELRAECRSKLPAFQVDPFYLYLKGRGFGTDRYSGRGPWRSLDRWLASLCNFIENHTSERTLLAVQEANEAASWQRDANRGIYEAEVERLRHAVVSGSEMSVVQVRRQQAQQALDAGKAQANALHEQLQPFVTRQDACFAKASELLAGQMAEMSHVTLERLAGQTTSLEDDELVLRIRDLRTELDELRLRVPLLEMKCRDATTDYERAKQVERELQSGEHISARYNYSDTIDLEALLAGFMRGGLSIGQVADQVDSFRQAAKVVSSASSSTHSKFSWSSSSSSTDGSSSKSSSSFSFSSSRSSGKGFSTSDSL
ncbi:hypothetical protein [Pseudomonas gingeri]|uniref:Uncharacterized protein n=1 Tax=Pseudomonas gingeri TaxID=117681 RepID=A0A7Y7YF71_9PSED|nr:hypothetical protein [Pseudomonas gingeri]NWA00835.1 hypothetical protein [Pseudomonas gingeri]NWA16121.1 hypothetical protein [Pseudomonas gingeri]NWA54311.1 hypothetical protein [Pseudomonas gingeri]NWA97612.1 hypothetical protein [Pseudomonas gingeri]NWB04418.1 hypothetical protein [Pseudomonas gingeri]